MRLFAIPDMAARRNRYELAIPYVGSLYLRHNLQGTIHSLNQYPRDDLPWVPLVFWSFRLMVGLGLLMTFASVVGLVVRLRRRLWQARWLHWLMVLMAPAGFIAMLAGWTVTEAGRQPWTVYGLLRTADSASPVSPSLVLGSLVMIVTVYSALFSLGFWFLLRVLSQPPQADEAGAVPDVARQTGESTQNG